MTKLMIKSKTNNPYGIESIFNILQILYLDNGAFIFAYKEDMIQDVKMIDRQFNFFEWKCM